MLPPTKIEDFGRALLETGDLDPVYTILDRAKLDSDHLRRWCFAYWCCYSVGAASFISDYRGLDYWIWLESMAKNDRPSPIGGRWPRGHERRHFRGDKAVEAVMFYENRWQRPEQVFDKDLLVAYNWDDKPEVPFAHIREVVMSWPQFGPWIAFKVADMMDRVMRVPVDFSQADVFVFDSPRDAAVKWFQDTYGADLAAVAGMPSVRAAGPVPTETKIRAATTFLSTELSQFKAPPFNDRRLNLQEFETILCKWKSSQSGHYPIGNDIREVRRSLTLWSAKSETATKLLQPAIDLELGLVRWIHERQASNPR